MGNKMNISKFKMILKEEVVRSLLEAPVAAPPLAIPSPVAEIDAESLAMQVQLKNEKPLPENFEGASTRAIELHDFIRKGRLMAVPAGNGSAIKTSTLNSSLSVGANIKEFWNARYIVLNQYAVSGRSTKGLLSTLGLSVTPQLQDFLDKGNLSVVSQQIWSQIKTMTKQLTDVERGAALVNLLTLLGYQKDSFIKNPTFGTLGGSLYTSYTIDIANISRVPLANIINIPKNMVADAGQNQTSTPATPSPVPVPTQPQQSADPSSKNSSATNWDQYVKMTPGGAAVKSAWEAYAATGRVKPDYYSFVAWYKKSKTAAGPKWMDDPGTVARLLQAKANLFGTPFAAPSPSITPGQATAQAPKP